MYINIYKTFGITIFNSIQVYLYSAYYDTIVAKQLYRKLSFYNIFIDIFKKKKTFLCI